MKRVLLALLLVTPAYGQTYDPTLIPAQIAGAPTTMTPLNLGDDNTAKVNLGFDFPYFDQTFSSAWVSSNGFISFQSSANLCCNGQPIAQAPRNTIYGFWTDLISGGNPYISRTADTFLVGWYNTKEYGTNNSETFEISLSSKGDIQFNYANVSLSYHQATAGITGPTWDDNVELFYGSNPSGLRNQSGILKATPLAVVVDCTVTPSDPTCPPEMVNPVQSITTATISTIAQAYAADVVADAVEVAAATIPEPVQEIVVVEQPVVTESIALQVAVVSTQIQAERLSPEQVAALSAIQSMTNESNTAQAAAAAAIQSTTSSSGAASSSEANSPSSPTSQANTNEVLAMSGGSAPTTTAAQSDQQQGNSSGQQDDFTAMTFTPAFSAYTQISLQDRSDFYAVRDIYRNRRLRDANFEMYRMSQTNDALWKDMVDEQYRR